MGKRTKGNVQSNQASANAYFHSMLSTELDPELMNPINVKLNYKDKRVYKRDQFGRLTKEAKDQRMQQEYEDYLKDHQAWMETNNSMKVANGKEPPKKRRKVEKALLESDKKNRQIHHLVFKKVNCLTVEAFTEKYLSKVQNYCNITMNPKRKSVSLVVTNTKEAEILSKEFKSQCYERKKQPSFTNTTKTIYIGNVDPDISADDIRDCFIDCGKIREVRKMENMNCAYITFKHRSSVEESLTFHNHKLGKYFIRVTEEKTEKKAL